MKIVTCFQSYEMFLTDLTIGKWIQFIYYKSNNTWVFKNVLLFYAFAKHGPKL